MFGRNLARLRDLERDKPPERCDCQTIIVLDHGLPAGATGADVAAMFPCPRGEQCARRKRGEPITIISFGANV